jgi:hypothetical protein
MHVEEFRNLAQGVLPIIFCPRRGMIHVYNLERCEHHLDTIMISTKGFKMSKQSLELHPFQDMNFGYRSKKWPFKRPQNLSHSP